MGKKRGSSGLVKSELFRKKWPRGGGEKCIRVIRVCDSAAEVRVYIWQGLLDIGSPAAAPAMPCEITFLLDLTERRFAQMYKD